MYGGLFPRTVRALQRLCVWIHLARKALDELNCQPVPHCARRACGCVTHSERPFIRVDGARMRERSQVAQRIVGLTKYLSSLGWNLIVMPWWESGVVHSSKIARSSLATLGWCVREGASSRATWRDRAERRRVRKVDS